MSRIESASHQLAEVIKGRNADYIEARLEENQTSHITYRGKQLESIGKASAIGGNVRALVKGGWGFVSFNDFDELPDKVDLAIKQASFVGSEESKLAQIEPAVEVVPIETTDNPVIIPLAEKKQLVEEYNEIIWQTPGIQTSTINYGDGRKKTIFLNSSGSRIEQERADVTMRVAAIATKDGDIQQAGLSIGSRGDFGAIQGIHSEVKELAQQAVELLSAPQVKGGEYTVILDPVLAGVFVHEAFGHLSESDFVYENDRLREIMTLGKTFGSDILNIVKRYDIHEVQRLLSENSYENAKSFAKKSLSGINSSNIQALFKKYETSNFYKLKNKYIKCKLTWDYDYRDLYVPPEYETTWHQDFFGDWYSITHQAGGDYTFTDYEGAYLHLKVENNFITINIKGDVRVAAKEETSAGDILGGIGGGLLGGLIGSIAAEVMGGDTDEQNAAFLAGAAVGSQSLWDKERATTLENIKVEAKGTVHHTGRVPLQGKQFACGHEPEIEEMDWLVY